MNTNKDIAGQNQKTDEIISQRRNAFTNAINANVNKSILFGLKEEDIATFLSPRKMDVGGEAELKARFNQEMQALQEASFNKFKTQKLAWDKSDELGKGVVGVNPLEPEKQKGWSNLLRAFSGIGLDALANIGERVTNESDLYNQTVAENLFNTVSASKGYNKINPTISGVASPNLTGFTNQFQGYAALGGDKQSTSFQKGTKLDYDENTLKELDKLGIKYKIVTE